MIELDVPLEILLRLSHRDLWGPVAITRDPPHSRWRVECGCGISYNIWERYQREGERVITTRYRTNREVCDHPWVVDHEALPAVNDKTRIAFVKQELANRASEMWARTDAGVDLIERLCARAAALDRDDAESCLVKLERLMIAGTSSFEPLYGLLAAGCNHALERKR
ncbi:MAG TPA: hypothetical protein VFD36_20635 [Kofleriaceae bacterium]|nr:hypothetical protein [Kofleriaceae bacterium]